MPRRDDIASILVIGSGPIVIGQACEFDYSGTQACRVLRAEGYRVILANSNPATIMTDPDLADRTYIEPLDHATLRLIIDRERPDAILPTMGGQTALNLAMELSASGTLEEFGVELIGAKIAAIETAENREQFKAAMEEIGLSVPESGFAYSAEEAVGIGEAIGFPIIVRPSFILGGAGTGIAADAPSLARLAAEGIAASPIGEVLIETSIAGWKEYELEVMRDHADNCVVVCSIENFDPMGVHTGDSITVAPAQTLSDVEYQEMRDEAFRCIRRVGVETGGSNIQFAVNPRNGERLVIEMNPRVSRSSALASKATGFPIAKIAARLAVGYRLDEIVNDITKVTPASFEPTIDYVVTKIPRWAFEKLPGAPERLGTRMQSVGEVMAIGRTFAESFQKAIRGLEHGRLGLNADPQESALDSMSTDALIAASVIATPRRPFEVEATLRRGVTVETLATATGIDPWFLDRIAEITATRRGLEDLLSDGGLDRLGTGEWRHLKRQGFSDGQVAHLAGVAESTVRAARLSAGVQATFKTVDTCGAEFVAQTPYYYSTFEEEDEVDPGHAPRVIILGSGPNRIGQGIEFDYCCVHAAMALRDAGYEAVMVNCNPETVSTDYDTSDRLYFEPITEEDVLGVLKAEGRGSHPIHGVIVGLGGQTPLKLAGAIPSELLLGTSASSIDLAEDRERWGALCDRLGIPQPPGATATTLAEALDVAHGIGYPALVRPSYVLGGRAMEIVYDDEDLERAMGALAKFGADGGGTLGREGGLSADRPVLIDRFLEDAIEVDVDAIRDHTGVVFIGGVMEHVEEAGVHSGDSACVIPPPTLSNHTITELEEITTAIARELGVIGPINVQFAVRDGQVFVIEANPRASRTVPFVAKATGIPLAKIAARVMAGASLEELSVEGLFINRSYRALTHVSVKEAVLPFSRFPEVDALLGPEMRSTGEVMGIAPTFALAFAKSQIAAGGALPTKGTAFFSLADRDKSTGIRAARAFAALGFTLAATEGTATALEAAGVAVETRVAKLSESQIDDELVSAVDLIAGGSVAIVVNTPRGRGPRADGAHIRRSASAAGIPVLTTVAAGIAAAAGIEETASVGFSVVSIQEHHEAIGR